MFKKQEELIVHGIDVTPRNEVTETRGNFYLSYNPGYMIEKSTAIVIESKKSTLFLILRGDYRKTFTQLSNPDSLLDHVKLFIEHISNASKYSDHELIHMEEKLLGIPNREEIRDLLGDEVFNLLDKAVEK